jgi:hypothetical protein
MIKKTIRLIILSIILSSNAQLFANDVGNNYVTAKSLKVNSIFKSSIKPDDDIDYYRLPISKHGVLKIFSSGDTNTKGKLLDFHQDVLAENNDDNEKEKNFFIEYEVNPGIYYVAVKSATSEETSGSYTLHTIFDSINANDSLDETSQNNIEIQSISSHSKSKKYPFEYKVGCVTKGKPFPFAQDQHCESVECFSLPPDYLYTLPINITTHKNGQISFLDACTWWPVNNVEIVPGLKLPNSICIKSRAKTPKGLCYGCRGWAHCSFSGHYIPKPVFKE